VKKYTLKRRLSSYFGVSVAREGHSWLPPTPPEVRPPPLLSLLTACQVGEGSSEGVDLGEEVVDDEDSEEEGQEQLGDVEDDEEEGGKKGKKGLLGRVRGLVSKKKKRLGFALLLALDSSSHSFQEDGFDLDLAYINKQRKGGYIIGMGFPSEGSSGMYRNPLSEV
jgi:hypothetical protein